MGVQAYVSPQRITKVDGPAVTNTTTIGSLLQPQDKIVVPGGQIQVGTGIRIHLLARVSTVVTTPGTLTISVRYNASVIAASTAFALSATAQTNDTFLCDVNLTCRTEGLSGNFMFDGLVASNVFTNAFSTQFFGPSTAPVVGATTDLSINGFIDVAAAWSIANAANSITAHQIQIEFLN